LHDAAVESVRRHASEIDVMRVAYVCADHGIPVFGCNGGAVHVQEMIRALHGLGHRVELFAAKVTGSPPADLERLPLHPIATSARGPAGLAEANECLRKSIAAAGPFDCIYERYSLWSYALMEYARDSAIPGILEVNAPLIDEQMTHGRPIDCAAAERVAARVFAAASLITVVSSELAGYVAQRRPAREPLHVVQNAVNPRRFSAHAMPTIAREAGTFTVGFLGSMKPWHGLSTLIDAFALLHERAPECRLLLIGDGPQRGAVEAALTARGLRTVTTLTGEVPPADVPGLLASVDAAVAPYPRLPLFYFSPLKVYEYMAAGLPTVASRVGQLGELISDGVTGLLCPADDAGGLAMRLELLRRDPHLRTRLGAAARARVLQGHTWGATAERVLSLAGLMRSAHPMEAVR
jgi:glycosyltransferase involved in cell wall biosynthesis